jgi:hypothetical protein
MAIAFEQAEDGTVIAANVWRPGQPSSRRLLARAKDRTPLPTIEEILALRRKTAAGAPGAAAEVVESYRLSGTIRFPHAAVDGRFAMTLAGDDRLHSEVDLGRLGQVRVALDGDRAWRDAGSLMEPFRELHGKTLEQLRLSHPAVLFGDWRQYFDKVSVVSTREVAERRSHLITLESGELPATRLHVDAETGDVVRMEQTILVPGAGGMPVTTLFEDYRNVHGLRIPYRQIETNEASGRTEYTVETVEVDLELAADAFVMRPPAESQEEVESPAAALP